MIRDGTRSGYQQSARELLFRSIDFLMLPCVHIAPFAAELPAPDSARPFEPWTNTLLSNLALQPASSLSCGLTATGMPVGRQIVGRRFEDVGVLRLSRVLEQSLRPLTYRTDKDLTIS